MAAIPGVSREFNSVKGAGTEMAPFATAARVPSVGGACPLPMLEDRQRPSGGCGRGSDRGLAPMVAGPISVLQVLSLTRCLNDGRIYPVRKDPATSARRVRHACGAAGASEVGQGLGCDLKSADTGRCSRECLRVDTEAMVTDGVRPHTVSVRGRCRGHAGVSVPDMISRAAETDQSLR
jgi:hypothetical protein